MEFQRWIVEVTANNDEVTFVANGMGCCKHIEAAYIYNRKELAEKKADFYSSRTQWYRSARVIPVLVIV